MQPVPWNADTGPSVQQWMQIASIVCDCNGMSGDQLQAASVHASCPALSARGDPAVYCFCARATLADLRVDFSYPVTCKAPFHYSDNIQLVSVTGKRCEGCRRKAYKKSRECCAAHDFRNVRQYLPVFRQKPCSAAGHAWKQVSEKAYAASLRGWWFCKCYGCALYEVGPVVHVSLLLEQSPTGPTAAALPAELRIEAGGKPLKRRRPALRALAGAPAGGSAGPTIAAPPSTKLRPPSPQPSLSPPHSPSLSTSTTMYQPPCSPVRADMFDYDCDTPPEPYYWARDVGQLYPSCSMSSLTSSSLDIAAPSWLLESEDGDEAASTRM